MDTLDYNECELKIRIQVLKLYLIFFSCIGHEGNEN